MPLFGTNGIRGVLNENITPELGYKFGMAVGTFYNDSSVALAHDNRTTSHLLKNVAEAGLLNSGKNVIDLGMIPTPAAQIYCKLNKIPGIMITASHNPPNFNGFKVIAKDGSNPGKTEESKIEEVMSNGNFNKIQWNSIGKVTTGDAVEPYLREIIKNVKEEVIRQRHFT